MPISLKKGIISGLLIFSFLLWLVSIYWGWMPSTYNVKTKTAEIAELNHHKIVAGYTTTSTLIELSSWLIEKPGGFLTNDVTPPALLMDNMPAFEYGVLEQVRDLALVMRLDFSRSQSQSTGD